MSWVQVLDFIKSLIYRSAVTENVFYCCFFFLLFFVVFFIVYVPCMRFITYMLFIISGEFDALRQLSVKKGSFGNTTSKA